MAFKKEVHSQAYSFFPLRMIRWNNLERKWNTMLLYVTSKHGQVSFTFQHHFSCLQKQVQKRQVSCHLTQAQKDARFLFGRTSYYGCFLYTLCFLTAPNLLILHVTMWLYFLASFLVWCSQRVRKMTTTTLCVLTSVLFYFSILFLQTSESEF